MNPLSSVARNLLKLTVFGLLSLSGLNASAALNLDTPAVLVQRAAQGRAQFFEVLRDLDKNIPEMRNRQEAEPYLLVLKDLDDVGKAIHVDGIAGGVFKDVALRMTRHALRWLDLDKDKTELVLRYHLYADDESSFEVVERVLGAIRSVQPKDRSLFVDNMLALEEWATARNAKDYLIEGYRELRAGVATEVLKDVYALSDSDRRYWLTHLATNTAIGSFLTAQLNYVLGLGESDRAKLHAIVELLAETRSAIEMQPIKVDAYFFAQLGELSRETISRYVRFEEKFAPGELDRVVLLLQRLQLQALTYIFTDPNLLPSKDYIPEFLVVAQVILSALESNGLLNERDSLKAYLEKLAGEFTASTSSLEGTYRVRTTDGTYWLFTLVFARHDMLIAGIGQEKGGSVYFAYYNLGYDLKNQAYVASERSPGEEVIRNAVIRFKFGVDNDITGTLENIPGKGRLDFSGKKTQDYNDLLGNRTLPEAAAPVDGVYEGRFKCNGVNKSLTLYVNTVNNHQIGRMSFNKEAFFLEFPFGLRQMTKSVIYLTSAKYPNRSFVHFRGMVTDGVLVGDYIIGGQGQVCSGITLKKTM